MHALRDASTTNYILYYVPQVREIWEYLVRGGLTLDTRTGDASPNLGQQKKKKKTKKIDKKFYYVKYI